MANIIDIQTVDVSTISPDEIFAIDTNVLFWTHYSKASDPALIKSNKNRYQVKEYPDFIAKLLQNGNKLVTTMLNITELFSVVERNEYNIYKIVNNQKISKKDFRKLSSERSKYKSEIDNMVLQIQTSYDNQIKIIDVDEKLVSSFQGNICNNTCDVLDYAVIEYLKRNKIFNYISDDKDFAGIEGISLYTTYGSNK